MQTFPTTPLLAPVLAPLSGQSSPASSFFLDQGTDAAAKQSRKKYKLEGKPPLSWLDDGEEEVDGVSVDEGRPLEKSHWSDDSDIDEDEDVDDQMDDEDCSGEGVTSATDVNAKDQEADGQDSKVGGRDDMAAAVVLEQTGGEEAKLSGNTHAGGSFVLDEKPRKDKTITWDIRNDARKHR